MAVRLLSLLLCSFIFLSGARLAAAQKRAAAPGGNVLVDSAGVLRWQHGRQEVALFGVNYTTPFAYAYRAHQRLGVPHEQAIRQDVYHLSRLGVDAFRVHVWDVEITDTAGNLLENEHLRLLDFLVSELKQRGIRIILTPIAYWNNGYPENDSATGFSSIYSKGAAYTNPRAIAAQERYLTQFLNHRNPYTKNLNREDPDILAFEMCNEPKYRPPLAPITSFADRLAGAIRATGCRKPVFYNVSENPDVYEAILNAQVDGLTFQWYPQGLVSNHTLHGNFLPYIDQYPIPFSRDARFRSKARMVYEFESADILQPIMYPFMARSFRTAGPTSATTNDVYFSRVSYVTSAPVAPGTDTYIGAGTKTGGVVVAPATLDLAGARFAYFNTPTLATNSTNSGLEIEIPLAALGAADATVGPGIRIELFAAYTDADGIFLTDMIPTIPGRTTVLGSNPDFTAIPGNQYVAFQLGTGVLASRNAADKTLELSMYPNPAPAATTLAYTVPGPGVQPVVLNVYNALGQRMRTVAQRQAGRQELVLDRLPAGMYWLKLRVGELTTSRQLVVE